MSLCIAMDHLHSLLQQHKNDISVNTHLACLKLQLFKNDEERNS